jgi:transcriptional regulator with XRE-family HTH domain
MAGRSAFERKVAVQLEQLRRQLRDGIRSARRDAGAAQARVATASGVSPAHYCEIEAGTSQPSFESLVRIAVALGRRPSFGLFPDSDPLVVDRRQAPIVEALLRAMHPRSSAMLEVPVYRPVHGVIDVVLTERAGSEIVAVEIQGGISRFEELLRWSGQKADALLESGPIDVSAAGAVRVSRLLVLASTEANRAIIRAFERSVRTVYPVASAEILRALTHPDVPWPGSGVIWATVKGPSARLVRGDPRTLGNPSWRHSVEPNLFRG